MQREAKIKIKTNYAGQGFLSENLTPRNSFTQRNSINVRRQNANIKPNKQMLKTHQLLKSRKIEEINDLMPWSAPVPEHELY